MEREEASVVGTQAGPRERLLGGGPRHRRGTTTEVPPPPPWGADSAAPLTELVSVALSPSSGLAVGFRVGVAEEAESQPAESPPAEPRAAKEAAAEPTAKEAEPAEEVEIDLDLEVEVEVEVAPAPAPGASEAGEAPTRPSRRLLHYLRDRFIDEPARVDAALAAYRGKYPSVIAYVGEVVDHTSAGLAGWLRPYIDLEALARDWRRAGALWVVEDPGGHGEAPGIHVFHVFHVVRVAHVVHAFRGAGQTG